VRCALADRWTPCTAAATRSWLARCPGSGQARGHTPPSGPSHAAPTRTRSGRAPRPFQRDIALGNVNLRGERALTLRHFQHDDHPLHDAASEVLEHVARLWGFGVHLESTNAKGDVTKRFSVAAPA
jgi:hypothetical protein